MTKCYALTAEELRREIRYDAEAGEFWWRISRNRNTWKPVGFVDGRGYVKCVINKKQYAMHRLAWLYTYGSWPSGQIDHVNGIKTDNRLCNLRDCSRSQNKANSGAHVDNRSGFKGVTRTKYGKYVAQIGWHGRVFYLGSFLTPEDAHRAYKKAALRFHGEFANFGNR